jgi:transposase InsO family protein
VPAATVSRYPSRAGPVTPNPAKRPKSSCIRFETGMPNERRQSDLTHYPLAGGTDTEIPTWLDDHSRHALSLTAHHRVTGPAVLLALRAACEQHGIPASTPTDNGMVSTTRLADGRGGRNALEHELRSLAIRQKNGKPNHPQTQGKAERSQQAVIPRHLGPLPGRPYSGGPARLSGRAVTRTPSAARVRGPPRAHRRCLLPRPRPNCRR